MEHSETIGQLAAAVARAQAAFEHVGKEQSATVQTTKGGQYSYSYAGRQAYLDAVKGALSKESLALFQPTRITEDGDRMFAVCTTLLVHESGEWIREEYRVPISDSSDARSGGSAATYAQKYGLKGLLGIDSEEEDDDAQAARGGQHEMASPQGGLACPACGVVGSVMKDSKTGGWACWKSKGGCETKWESGPFPTAAPLDLMPRRKAPSAPEQATTGASGVASAPRGEVTTGAESSKKRGTKPVEQAAIPDGNRAKTGTFQAMTDTAPVLGEGQVTFIVGPTGYVTNGLTEAQFLETVRLVPAVDRATKKGASKDMLMEMFGYETRLELTKAQGEEFLQTLYAKLPEQGA